MVILHFLVLFFPFALSNGVESRDGLFIQPPPRVAGSADEFNYEINLQWPIGTFQTVRWWWNATEEPKWKNYTIYLYNQNLTEKYSSRQGHLIWQMGDDQEGSFRWLVTPGKFDISKSGVFYFWALIDWTTFNYGFASHFFNITEAVDSSSSVLTPTPTAASSVSSSSFPFISTLPPMSDTSSSAASEAQPTSFTSVTATATLEHPTNLSTESSPQAAPGTSAPKSTLSAQPTASSSPKQSAKQKHTPPLALGISLGLGIPLLILATILFGIKFMRTQRTRPGPQNPPVDQGDTAVAELQSPPPQYNDLPEYRPPVKWPIKA